MATRIPVTLITGFLGSGKTTLLGKLLHHPDMGDVAVIVNEFGEVGLDYMLLESSNEDIIELNSGCLCCEVQGDLANTLLSLLYRRVEHKISQFNHVVIETTGLADPAPLVQMLMTDTAIAQFYNVGSIATVVDAVNGFSTLDHHPESVKQVALADRIILSKTDMLEQPDQIKPLVDRIRAINPMAKILTVVQGEIHPRDILAGDVYDPTQRLAEAEKWLAQEACQEIGCHDNHPHANHTDDIDSYCVIREEPIRMEDFINFMDMLKTLHGEDLLRVKGILNIKENPETPAVIHGVQQVIHAARWMDQWPTADHRSRLVFITRNIPKKRIDDLLDVIIDYADREKKRQKWGVLYQWAESARSWFNKLLLQQITTR